LIGGALLAGLSIMLPWYSVQLFGLDESVSGIQARDQASVLLIFFAAAACGGFGVRREFALVAAVAAAALVAACFISVPEVPKPEEFRGVHSVSIGLSRAWGLWVAAAGAAAMLVGAIRLVRR
jgi:hypothetical protein